MAMKTYCVNFSRTIVIEGTLQLDARNETDARLKAKELERAGGFGSYRITSASPRVRDAQIDSETDTVEIEDAFCEDD
jgi:hypothetical protein